MDLGDMLNKAKDAAHHVSDENIDKAADFIEDKVDDRFDGLVDKAADAAKKLND